MNNDVLNIINIDKMIGMEYPNSNSAFDFTIRINDIETTPTLYTISIDYGVEHYNAATIIVNRVKNFKVVDVLGYDIELLLNGFPNMNTYNDKAVFTIDMFETPTIFLRNIKNFVEREINNLPF
jgi:hypothetical protein